MKTYALRFFNCSILSLFFYVLAFAQPIPTTTIIRGNSNGNGYSLSSRDCSEGLVFDIYVANLDLLNNEGIMGGGQTAYALPSYAPTMYVSIFVNDLPETFTQLNAFEFSHNVYGVNIYKASISIDVTATENPINFRVSLLKEFEAGDPVTSEYDSLILNNYSYSLPSGYSFYPIGDYRTPGDLFPCDIEGWTECGCNFDQFGGDCFMLPFYSGSTTCDQWGGDGDSFGPGYVIQDSGNDQSAKETEIIKETKAEVSISPNPFTSAFQVEYNATKAKTINIQIIDIAGRVILTEQTNVIKGSNNINVSLNDASNGLYIVKLTDEEQIITKNIVKY